MVKQVSVFLENRAGRLHEVTNLLAKSGLNIRALSLADTSDFGILRIILNDPEAGLEVLRKEGYTVSTTDVVAIEVDDKPGGLARALGIFHDNGINIEYMYAFLGKDPAKAIMIFRFDDNSSVMKKLEGKGVQQIEAKDLYAL
jgi:hypothetical protein